MKTVHALGALALLTLGARADMAQKPATCAPSMGLRYVCGLNEPEDLLQIGASKWIIASGMGDGGGVSLVDSEARTARRFFTVQSEPDRRRYPDCAAPPDIAVFNSHGLALIPAGAAGTYTLYTVTHTPFESIHVFAVDARGTEPSISWTGCVKLPADFKTNSVTATRDGAILADVQMKNGATSADFMRDGKNTGGVYEWTPAAKTLRLLPGTELPGNNGIEISRDEKEFYVAASGNQTVYIFDRADTSRPVRQVRTPWFNLDNIHWSGNRLIAAGMMFDEPACGGTRKQMLEHGANMACHRGWVAAELDPKTLQWTVLGYAEPNPDFGGIATALVINRTLWISSFQMDRIAYRTLPGPH